MYIKVSVGICRYVPGDMWYMVHHFPDVVSLAGSVVHSANSAPDDGCSSPRTVKAVLLWFASLLLSWFLRNETQHCMCITFYAQLRTKIRYLHKPTKTCLYMHIHAHTCWYIQILADTDIYCMYVHVCACIACMCRYNTICRYCMYVMVLPVSVGMSLCVCIACICRYCRYV